MFQTWITFTAGEHKIRYSSESQAQSFGYNWLPMCGPKCDSYDSCCEKKNEQDMMQQPESVVCKWLLQTDWQNNSCKTNSSDTLMLNDTEIN